MSKISENFYRSELSCNCGCGKNTVDAELLMYLEKIRSFFEKPVIITSGNRCKTYNKVVGGSPGSMHLVSRAADIQVVDVSPHVVAEYAEQIKVPGVGRYETFTHIDSRNGPLTRWIG
jgi:uncharacterized protein YcbK (DUF882 family)